MKPLFANSLDSFLKRFDNFRDGELRSIEVISPSVIRVMLAGQDNARAYDWITIEFEFNGVQDARLLEVSKLSFVDMSEGISIIAVNNLFAFGIGKWYNIEGIKNSTCQVMSSSLKYQEGSF